MKHASEAATAAPAATAAASPRVNAASARLAALVAVAVGIPIALAYAARAMQIPRIDDWAFGRIAYDLYSTGHFRLLGWGEMTMIGHELYGLPFVALFGRSITALHWAGAIAAAAGLVGTFSLYRRFVSPRLALFGTATLAALPSFAVLATTYMTDLTSYAGELVCLTVGLAALRSGGRRANVLLAVSLLAGFWAFTCRESSIAAPLAIVAGELLTARKNRRPLRRPIALGLGLVVAAAVLYAWRKGLPNDDHSTQLSRPGLPEVRRSVPVLADAWFTVALGLLPILFLCRRRVTGSLAESLSARWVALVVGLGGLALVLVTHHPYRRPMTVLDGIVLTKFGTGGPENTMLGTRAPLFPGGVWLALNLAAVAAGALLAGALWAVARSEHVRRGPRRLPSFRQPPVDVAVVLVYTAFTVALLAFRAVEKGFLYDRYYLTLAMALGLLALRWLAHSAPVSPRAGAGALAAVALVTAVLVLDVNSYDTARWSAAEAAVARGVPPTDVSAGFEWIGAHHPGPIAASEHILGAADKCVLVAIGPLPGPTHHLREVRKYGPVGLVERRLLVYDEARPRCGP